MSSPNPEAAYGVGCIVVLAVVCVLPFAIWKIIEIIGGWL